MTYYNKIINFFLFININILAWLIIIFFLISENLKILSFHKFSTQGLAIFYLIALKFKYNLPYLIFSFIFSLYVKYPILNWVNLQNNIWVELIFSLILSWFLSFFFRRIFEYLNFNKQIFYLYYYLKEYAGNFKSGIATRYTVLHCVFMLPYHPNKWRMIAPIYRIENSWILPAIEMHFLREAALLRDQCQILQNSLQYIDPNSPWSHIFSEFISRSQRDITLFERRASQVFHIGTDMENMAFEAHAKGRDLIINFLNPNIFRNYY